MASWPVTERAGLLAHCAGVEVHVAGAGQRLRHRGVAHRRLLARLIREGQGQVAVLRAGIDGDVRLCRKPLCSKPVKHSKTYKP